MRAHASLEHPRRLEGSIFVFWYNTLYFSASSSIKYPECFNSRCSPECVLERQACTLHKMQRAWGISALLKGLGSPLLFLNTSLSSCSITISKQAGRQTYQNKPLPVFVYSLGRKGSLSSLCFLDFVNWLFWMLLMKSTYLATGSLLQSSQEGGLAGRLLCPSPASRRNYLTTTVTAQFPNAEFWNTWAPFPSCSPALAKRLQSIYTDLLHPSGQLEA